MKILPPKKQPVFKNVKLHMTMRHGVITYSIVTARMGFVVGSRLDKGRGKDRPQGAVSGLNLAEAKLKLAEWEKFCEEQKGK